MTRQRLTGAALAALLGWALAGCAAWMPLPQTAALQQQAPADLPRRAENTGVPFFPQTPYHCGPAALATALGHIGRPTDPQVLADAVFVPSRGGSLQIEMLAAARRQGVLATRVPGELQALLREVAAGHAVVLLQNLGLSMAPVWHYAVLVGYDLDAGELLLRSGTTERERLPLHTFERTWARAGHWAMVLLPPGRWPVSATPQAALEAAVGFERSAAAAASVSVYRSLVQRWPAWALAGIGLGNSLHAAGDTAAAAEAFEAVAQRHDSAVAWNNLAQLRLSLGDTEAARRAARCAVLRAEQAEPVWLPAAHATLALLPPAVAVPEQSAVQPVAAAGATSSPPACAGLAVQSGR